MKELVLLSGKGGTGKTSIAGSFAALAGNTVLADCDVDAADLYLILQPETRENHEFWSGQVAVIDEDRCTRCGLCQELCRFDAIHDFSIDSVSCEGCGFCSRICPEDAITMKDTLAGEWYVSDTRFGPLVHARLGIAQENSGKLVAAVRQKAQQIAATEHPDCIITDGPPGIGCPVISSLSGADVALLVTEPTLSGRHDLERVIGTCNHFGVKPAVCINKYDINPENSYDIEEYCFKQGIKVTGKIRFDNAVTEAMVHGLPVVEYASSTVSRQIEDLWEETAKLLKE
ncbi:ATP-binding protein [Chloroflexota bacterium]